ncbi:PREDICTED: uncharacterized protein LOC106811519 isoform X2 [Priapulus caudatus]|uniref:Uncharacterized protein LOC106811519 isoform X2 n=1 Tax=Priapulus caudatus TaxID=37621 RepID=A0ABM1EEP4_PRICU|nr:PREDICTED: uncharacterized protein LOC106811519 isoform X2 [Priapulus caudatus]
MMRSNEDHGESVDIDVSEVSAVEQLLGFLADINKQRSEAETVCQHYRTIFKQRRRQYIQRLLDNNKQDPSPKSEDVDLKPDSPDENPLELVESALRKSRETRERLQRRRNVTQPLFTATDPATHPATRPATHASLLSDALRDNDPGQLDAILEETNREGAPPLAASRVAATYTDEGGPIPGEVMPAEIGEKSENKLQFLVAEGAAGSGVISQSRLQDLLASVHLASKPKPKLTGAPPRRDDGSLKALSRPTATQRRPATQPQTTRAAASSRPHRPGNPSGVPANPARVSVAAVRPRPSPRQPSSLSVAGGRERHTVKASWRPAGDEASRRDPASAACAARQRGGRAEPPPPPRDPGTREKQSRRQPQGGGGGDARKEAKCASGSDEQTRKDVSVVQVPDEQAMEELRRVCRKHERLKRSLRREVEEGCTDREAFLSQLESLMQPDKPAQAEHASRGSDCSCPRQIAYRDPSELQQLMDLVCETQMLSLQVALLDSVKELAPMTQHEEGGLEWYRILSGMVEGTTTFPTLIKDKVLELG